MNWKLTAHYGYEGQLLFSVSFLKVRAASQGRHALFSLSLKVMLVQLCPFPNTSSDRRYASYFGVKKYQIGLVRTYLGLLDMDKTGKPLSGFIDDSCTATRARQAVELCFLGSEQIMCVVFFVNEALQARQNKTMLESTLVTKLKL